VWVIIVLDLETVLFTEVFPIAYQSYHSIRIRIHARGGSQSSTVEPFSLTLTHPFESILRKSRIVFLICFEMKSRTLAKRYRQ
jgi:hypothetical protein